MRVCSIRAPWPWFMFHAGKDIENRDRNIAGNYRGPVAIHQSSYWDEKKVERDIYAAWEMWSERKTEIRNPANTAELKAQLQEWRGKIIGTVQLTRVIAAGTKGATGSPWYMGEVGLVLAQPRLIAKPIPFRGQLGLFNASPDLARALSVQASPGVEP